MISSTVGAFAQMLKQYAMVRMLLRDFALVLLRNSICFYIASILLYSIIRVLDALTDTSGAVSLVRQDGDCLQQ